MIRPSGLLPGPIEPLRGKDGASMLGPRNPAREAEDRDLVRPPSTDKGSVPNLRWSFADSHNRIEPGGWARETTVRELPVSTAMAGVNMRLDRGGVREMHWHKTAEWSYVLAGQARITAVDEEGRTFQADMGVGRAGAAPVQARHDGADPARAGGGAPQPGPRPAGRLANRQAFRGAGVTGRVAGKTAAGSGAACGISKASAALLAQEGADVIGRHVAGPVSPTLEVTPATPHAPAAHSTDGTLVRSVKKGARWLL